MKAPQHAALGAGPRPLNPLSGYFSTRTGPFSALSSDSQLSSDLPAASSHAISRRERATSDLRSTENGARRPPLNPDDRQYGVIVIQPAHRPALLPRPRRRASPRSPSNGSQGAMRRVPLIQRRGTTSANTATPEASCSGRSRPRLAPNLYACYTVQRRADHAAAAVTRVNNAPAA